MLFKKDIVLKDNLKTALNEEHKGFVGYTHWLIAVACFLLMWVIPNKFSSGFINAIASSWAFAFLIFFVIGGGSLLPDLDSAIEQGGGSAAIYQLGFIGHLLSLLCVTISGVFYSIFHTKYDKKPKSQHRMLFHAPIIPILIFIYSNWMIPVNESNLWHNIKNIDYAGIIVLVFFAGCCIYLGANMFFYKTLSLINKHWYTSKICTGIMIISIIYMFTVSFDKLRLIGIAMSLGYLFHVLSDVFTKGSAPLFFPIPIPSELTPPGKFRFWWHPYIISSKFTVTTGSVINIILNFALIGLDIFLAWFIFFR